jgi:two-component system cell cycle response regulator
MADIDFFKSFNDTYGHQEGDRCLHAVAQAISAVVKRSSDIPARYGGEEFAILLPHTDIAGAVTIAEQIRQEILGLEISHASSDINEHLTLSLGVTSVVPGPELKPEALILSADRALYQAKNQGRNRFISG